MKVLVNSCIKKKIVFVIAFLAQLHVLAQKPDALLYKQQPYDSFVFISNSAITPHLLSSDSLFDAVAGDAEYEQVKAIWEKSEGNEQQCTEHTTYVQRHLMAVRTNLLHDFLYVPQFGFASGGNIQLEYYPLRGHYTFNAGFTFSNHCHWRNHKFFQMRDVQLELRRYFKGDGIFLGTYLGAYLEGNKYGIGFSDTKGWQGEGGGAGISVGHTCRLTKKGDLRLELSMSAGAYLTLYDPYVYGNPISRTTDGRYYYNYLGSTSQFKERNHRFIWIGPTNAGIHLTYDIIYRKKKEVKP